MLLGERERERETKERQAGSSHSKGQRDQKLFTIDQNYTLSSISFIPLIYFIVINSL
ncbi:MAG: hypothetical protein NY202_02120 [Mollicutes bacterium UO1]